MASRRAAARPRAVTIVADIGAAYAAQMVGVLATRAPSVRVLTVVADLPRQDVRSSAWILRSIAERFPPGTIHVCVVDPGVGTSRAPIAIECAGGTVLVGPDNGVLGPTADRLGMRRAVRLDRARVGATPIGSTFDGRDLFAPAAALLARGRPIAALGPTIRPRPGSLGAAIRTRGGARASVAYIDPFGNAVTNVPSDWIPRSVRSVDVRGGRLRDRAGPLVASYEALGPGGWGLLRSSFGSIEIAVDRGSAADRYRLASGSPVELRWVPGPVTPRGRGVARARPVRGPPPHRLRPRGSTRSGG